MSNNFKDQIFSPTFSLDGAHLVEASAGTGKTYNIQNIYARLIMEKDLQVSQIQVMTFTEAATKELRDRLRTVLKDIQMCFNEQEFDDIQRRNRASALIQCVPESDRELARQRIELALLMFDNAAISTIHGFCSRALSRFAFETHLNFTVEIKDNKSEELSQRVRDWWQSDRLAQKDEKFRDSRDLGKLQGYVYALSKKADWELRIPKGDEGADASMLRQAVSIVQAYENDRCNRTSQTYDDLLRSMREALNGRDGTCVPSDNFSSHSCSAREALNGRDGDGTEFSKLLREEFKAALIDEFQDTDPVQYDIFQKAFLCDKKFPIFFVGDPKQAIYSFRGGDIFTYRKATEGVPPKEKYSLNENFRSTPRLMDAVNAIFRDREGNWTFGDKSIPYSQDISACGGKTELMVDGKEDRAPFKIVEIPDAPRGEQDIDLYHALARMVAQTLNDYRGTISPKDIAILVNFHKNARKISDQLKQHGIPCVLQKTGNVFSGPSQKNWAKQKDESDPALTAHDFQTVLKAAAGVKGAEQVRAALITPFFGCSPEELLEMSEDKLAQWLEKFRSLSQLWQKRGFAAALGALEKATIREDGKGFQERLAALPDGERRLTDYYQITELAMGVSQTKGSSPDVILKWLDERINRRDDEQDSEEYTRQLESESDAVKIMTIHVSKGLQFPIVFLPDCNVSAHTNSPAVYHDSEKNDALIFDLAANQRSTEEDAQEQIRKLYVAMTRAVQRTVVLYKGEAGPILGGLLENARQNIGDKESPIEWLDEASLPAEDVSYTPEVKPLELVKEVPQPPEYDHHPIKGSYTLLSPNPKSSAIDGKDRDQEDSGQGEEGEKDAAPIFHIRGGALIGSCWHEILEKVSFQATAEEIRELSCAVLRSYGFKPEEPVADGQPSILDVTAAMIRKTLDYPLADKDGAVYSLKDVEADKRLSEQEFNVSSADAADTTQELAAIIRKHWEGDESKKPFLEVMKNWNRQIPKGFLNGFIDLLYEHNGATYVVDWKSNSLRGNVQAFNAEGITHEMAHHGYFFQYLLYAAILQKYLKETMGSAYSWEKNFGGIRYFFLRGVAAEGEAPVYADRPSEKMLDELAEKLCGSIG